MLGELAGFIPPAVVGANLASRQAGDAALVAGLVLAGLAEGAVLGAAQAHVLHAALPALRRRWWVLATAAAAGVAWLAGMGGVQLVQAVGPLAWLIVGPGMVVGLLSMGVLQWGVMRRHVEDARRWIWVTSAAWLVGVLIPVAALSVLPNSWPPPAHGAVAVLAAVAMGATVGVITGATLVRLVRDPRTVRHTR
jgi:peptidoglycan/LPS O-acetylase OafA/YrhL